MFPEPLKAATHIAPCRPESVRFPQCCSLSALLLLVLAAEPVDAQPEIRDTTIKRPQIGRELRIDRRLEMLKPDVVEPDGRLKFALPDSQTRVLRPDTSGWKVLGDSANNGNERTEIELKPDQAVFLLEKPPADGIFSPTVEIPADKSQVTVPLRSSGLGTVEVVEGPRWNR